MLKVRTQLLLPHLRPVRCAIGRAAHSQAAIHITAPPTAAINMKTVSATETVLPCARLKTAHPLAAIHITAPPTAAINMKTVSATETVPPCVRLKTAHPQNGMCTMTLLTVGIAMKMVSAMELVKLRRNSRYIQGIFSSYKPFAANIAALTLTYRD